MASESTFLQQPEPEREDYRASKHIRWSEVYSYVIPLPLMICVVLYPISNSIQENKEYKRFMDYWVLYPTAAITTIDMLWFYFRAIKRALRNDELEESLETEKTPLLPVSRNSKDFEERMKDSTGGSFKPYYFVLVMISIYMLCSMLLILRCIFLPIQEELNIALDTE
ncbi:uncharacterized protein LY89DRAFT_730219 [Mollisia scopiformis]|uniref:Uncharacterized protein n=1 Tax=Mollisia scopiformis TaxID=149040 RepID=A0A194XMG4_MOLSC|nr:uncharacterized protein LY89DRAFT_730219 [Mollisia scopiformis]KUJ21440.1 hypothetical protein LY89DRAFT_730219 [Mollisia scopiformis]